VQSLTNAISALMQRSAFWRACEWNYACQNPCKGNVLPEYSLSASANRSIMVSRDVMVTLGQSAPRFIYSFASDLVSLHQLILFTAIDTNLFLCVRLQVVKLSDKNIGWSYVRYNCQITVISLNPFVFIDSRACWTIFWYYSPFIDLFYMNEIFCIMTCTWETKLYFPLRHSS